MELFGSYLTRREKKKQKTKTNCHMYDIVIRSILILNASGILNMDRIAYFIYNIILDYILV